MVALSWHVLDLHRETSTRRDYDVLRWDWGFEHLDAVNCRRVGRRVAFRFFG